MPTKYDESKFTLMAQMYDAGATLDSLAKQFGVTIPTMSKYVKKGGGTLRTRGQRRKYKEKNIVAAGGTVPTIAPAGPVTTDTVVADEQMVKRQLFSVAS